jgi:phospholipid/cholesterol/gamma-HCH transport system ATP-binding protein
MSLLTVHDLEMRFGDRLIQQAVSFTVEPGSIFAIMGGSGCGKSTLLKHLVGLLPPASGRVTYGDIDYWAANEAERNRLRAGFGMLFQSAALWSSMTLLENICLPLEKHTTLSAAQRLARAQEVLEWVDLARFGNYFPADISGGMKKRAGLARAIAAEPPLLFLDEPSAGLDPISSRRLDDLVLELRDRTGAAVVFVSHELPSLFAIADDGIFLDADSKRPIAHGSPRALRDQAQHPTVHAFLHREATPTESVPAPVSVPVLAVTPSDHPTPPPPHET